MNTTLLRQASQLFKTYNAPPEVIARYKLKWAKSITLLGDKWLLAKPIQKSNKVFSRPVTAVFLGE